MSPAGCPRGHIPRERCPLCHIPRTGVIALHNLLRGQRCVPASIFRERRVAVALSRENALLHYQACCADNNTSVPSTVISTEAEKSLTLYACFCNEHWLAYTNRAFIAYPGDFSTAHGLIPCSARNDMRSLPTLCHSEPPRMRRVEESA